MNKKFNVISENNLEYIDFHDCECSRLYYENDTLVLEMDCMEVLSEHPMNPHDKAHQSGEGMVMLQLPKIEQLVLYKNNSEIISVNDFNNVDFRDTILLQYDESKTNDGYKAKIYLLFNNNKEFDSALIEISYNKSVAMWDELKDVCLAITENCWHLDYTVFILRFKEKGGNAMEIKILTKSEQDKYDNEILDMLTKGDTEFLPPLSARCSTTQSNLKGIINVSDGVLNYFKELKKQRILVATAGGQLLGFVSFKENFVNEKIGEEDIPNIYISTLLVSPEARGKGLTSKMYEILFAEYENANIFTRTWSTNEAHIKILSKFGFEAMLILKNDRGNGIDTIYLKKASRRIKALHLNRLSRL